jgi:hypothetical protein
MVIEIDAGASVTFNDAVPVPAVRLAGISFTPDSAAPIVPAFPSSSSAHTKDADNNRASAQNINREVMVFLPK